MTHSSEEEMQTDSPAEEEMDDLEEEEESLDRSTPSLSLPRTPPAVSHHINLASSASRGTFGSADNTQQTLLSAAELSPPDSQPRDRSARSYTHSTLGGTGSSHAALAAAAGSSHIFNSNGKRPLIPAASDLTMLEANEDDDLKRADSEKNGEKQGPGSTWKNKRGTEEISRAMEMVVDREYMVGKMYGDVLDVTKDEKLTRLLHNMMQ